VSGLHIALTVDVWYKKEVRRNTPISKATGMVQLLIFAFQGLFWIIKFVVTGLRSPSLHLLIWKFSIGSFIVAGSGRCGLLDTLLMSICRLLRHSELASQWYYVCVKTPKYW